MKKTMIVIGIILMLIIGAYVVLINLPQIGKKPSGERLERLMKSENYKNNFFQNKDETNMEKPPWEGIKEMMKKGIDRAPSKPLETIALDKSRYENAAKEEVLITWLGHSTVLIKLNGKTILIDPVFSKRASLFQFLGPKQFEYSTAYSIESLPKIDIVLLTHDHYDHLDYEVIKSIKNTVERFYMPLGVGSHLEHWGVASDRIVELDWWETVNDDGIGFTATPGRHFTGRLFNDRFKTLWCGWSIKTAEHSLFHSGDSGYFGGFKEIGERLGPFDISFIECGQYSKYWPFIHMMPEESVQAAIDIKSSVALPIHWGKFNLSIHAWYEPPTRFSAKANQVQQDYVIPQIGETFTIDKKPVPNFWWKQ